MRRNPLYADPLSAEVTDIRRVKRIAECGLRTAITGDATPDGTAPILAATAPSAVPATGARFAAAKMRRAA